jgi:hypothetical protein
MDSLAVYADVGDVISVIRHISAKEKWGLNGLCSENQEFRLAHEMTHSVQYGELGTVGFLSRYLPEWRRGPDANYGIPDSLLGGPVNMSNIVSPSYTLDQIAQQNAHLVVPDNTIGWWKRGELGQ